MRLPDPFTPNLKVNTDSALDPIRGDLYSDPTLKLIGIRIHYTMLYAKYYGVGHGGGGIIYEGAWKKNKKEKREK